jgi:uroporphyrinogen decarboxylase
MRQAGRYMPEYRALRQKYSFLELCHTPEAAVAASMLPIDMLGVDGAIIFSDILIPLEAMGMNLQFDEGKGPILSDPIRSRSEIGRLRAYDANKETRFLPDAIRMLKAELAGRVPVLGFAGAPYTLACYAVEGKTARHYSATKSFMLNDREGFKELLFRFADAAADLLIAQIEAGAELVQLFDTWAGDLMPDEFRAMALPAAAHVIERVKATGCPIVYFVNGVGGKLEDIASSGADVIGIDWRVGLTEVRERLGQGVVLQGNLDPCTLYARPDVIAARVRDVLAENGRGPHIFNLGHGIMPDVPVAHAKALVDAVKTFGAPGGYA